MESLKTLILVLTPMFIGFAVRLPKPYLSVLDRLLSLLVYLILLLIGIGLAHVGQLFSQLDNIAFYAGLLFVLLIACNLFFLGTFDRLYPWQHQQQKNSCSKRPSMAGGLKQLGIVAVGLVLGNILPHSWQPPESAATAALMLLILIVGIQLRSSGIPLRHILLNKRGCQTAAIFMLSCALAGSLYALFTRATWQQGLALSSGYGWYSLSGIVMTQAYDATWGSVALLNDLLRELFALAFIPIIMHRHPSSAVGIGGATSLDFTLPVIQQSGGTEIVPVAISFGFVVNILSPILMVIFTTL